MRILPSETPRGQSILIGWAVSAIFSISLMVVSPACAQDCTPESIRLSSQVEVDDFQNNHGPCNRAGYLSVSGADIVNLEGLANLSSVDELRIESNAALTNIDGLANLTSVGSNLVIRSNETLINVNGLTNLTSVGWALAIISNSALTDIGGLENLAATGPINILDNASLTDIDGLSNLTAVQNELHISSNAALNNIDGLVNLTSLSGDLTIDGNEVLTNINGLANLTNVEWNLGIWGNAALRNIDGLANLTSVGLMLSVSGNEALLNIDGLANLTNVGQDLYFDSNAALTNLEGLSAVTNVGGDLILRGHVNLTNLDGLSSIQSVNKLLVGNNIALSDCLGIMTLVDPIDDYEPGPGPGSSGIPDVAQTVWIQNNGKGCNSANEILGQVPLYEMNAGLNDAWFNFDTDGQGFLITVFPEIKKMFMAWFTYDTERPPVDATAILGEPGHRWLTAQGEYIDNLAELTLYVTAGGEFDSEEPKPITEPYGEVLLEFSTCNAGSVTYDIPSIFQQRIVTIERIALDNVSLCYILGKQAEAETITEGD